MEFKFFNYVFSDDLNALYHYLSENKIEYKTRKKTVSFKIPNDYCKSPIHVLVTFQKDKVIRIELYCQPISYNNRKAIEEEINSNYKLIKKNLDTFSSSYQANDYIIKLVNPEEIWIDVQFEKVIENKVLEDKKYNKKVFLFTIVGIVLSILFIVLYFSFKDLLILNVFNAIIAFAYAMFQFYYIYLKDTYKSKGVKIAICIVIPFCYICGITLASIMVGLKSELIIDFLDLINILDVLFVFVYLSPSFHILLLLVAALGYI